METTERLQRVLAARGVSSRRKAEDLIREGRVRVNGEIVTELGVRVDPVSARIEVDGRQLRPQRMRYLLMNKPSGYITTTSDERGRPTVLDLVSVPERVYPVGRLDRDTDGLLLLTNDGEVANRVMHPRYGLTKEYNILTKGRPPEWMLERVRRGLTIDGKRVTPEAFRILRETHDGVILTMTIHEGMNHIVRRLMDEAGIPVVRLRRVRVGPLSLASIPVGAYRDLTSGELGSLLEALRLHEPDTADGAVQRSVPPRAAASNRRRRSRPAPTTPTRGGGERPPPKPRRSRSPRPATGADGKPGTDEPRAPKHRNAPPGAGKIPRRDRGGRSSRKADDDRS